MKQRLLLALLVLFAAAGMVKADENITFKVTKGQKATVKISGENATTTPGDFITGEGITNEKFVYTIDNTSGSSDKDVTINAPSSSKSFTTLVFEGGISSITIGAGEDYITSVSVDASTLTSLDLSGIRETLETLNIASTAIENNTVKTYFTGDNTLTALKSFTCSISQLSAGIGSTPANKGFDMSNVRKDLSIPEGNTNYTYRWYKQANGSYPSSTTNEAVSQKGANDIAKDEFRFYDTNKIYVKGTYKCEMTANGKTFIVEGLQVTPAEFTIEFTKPVKATSLTITDNDKDEDQTATADDTNTTQNITVFQGDNLLISTKAANGYEFEKYIIAGLDTTGSGTDKNPMECIVQGKYVDRSTEIAPLVEARVIGNKHTIKFDQPTEGGDFTVSMKKEGTTSPINSGDKVEVGSDLIIALNPQQGYGYKVSVNGYDKTNDVKSYKLVLSSISDKDYMITVTYFKKETVKIKVLIDGEVISSSEQTWLNNSKVFIRNSNDNTNVAEITNQNGVDLNIGIDCQIYFDVKKESSIIVNDIILEGKSLTKLSDASKSAVVRYSANFTVPNQDATIMINTSKLNNLEIIPKDDDDQTSGNQQTYIYDGTSKKVMFTTKPAGLENKILVHYQKENANGADLGSDAPSLAGTYYVELSYKGDNIYKSSLATVTLTIQKATPSITQLPTVTVDSNTGKYIVTGGEAKIGDAKIKGDFRVVNDTKDNSGAWVAKESPEDEEKTVSHRVKIQFIPSENKSNLTENATADVEVKIGNKSMPQYAVSIVNIPTGISVQMFNGNQPVTSGQKFITGTTIQFAITYPEGTSNVTLVGTHQTAPTVTGGSIAKSGDVCSITVGENAAEYTIKADLPGSSYAVSLEKQEAKDYSGQPQKYDLSASSIKILDNNKNKIEDPSSIINTIQLTYKNSEGTLIPEPINAGKYKVCIRIPANNGYKEFYQEFSDVFEIKQALPIIREWPKAERIAIGQKLSQSVLIGGTANIAGAFAWIDGSVKPEVTQKHEAKFVPTDVINYKTVTTPNGTDISGSTPVQDERIEVVVTDQQIITFNPINGSIVVKDEFGNKYESGNAVSEGRTLTITSTPTEGFELSSLTINDQALTGSSYKVGKESVAIEAVFKVKTPAPASVVITLPANGRGYILSHNGAKSVAFNGSYTFNVSTLSADKKNLVVKAGSDVLTPNTDGSYTVKADKDKTITVSLPTPTKLKVSVERVTKNAKGNIMGKVEVEGLSTTDSTCYYGDEVTIVAFPESGVTFGGWNGITSTDKLATFTVKEPMTIKPKFSGIPTGIETIEGMRIYGREGHIFIGCDGEAKVTLISMDGRVKKVEISGDSRIETAAGVYGVIVEKGSEVLKEKVIVK